MRVIIVGAGSLGVAVRDAINWCCGAVATSQVRRSRNASPERSTPV